MRTILAAVIAAHLVLTGSHAGAQEVREREISLKIDSATLAGALDQWAAQTGVQLVSPSWEIAKKLTATPIKGRHTARGALEKLLNETPLTGEWISDKAVAIREKSSAASAPPRTTRTEPTQPLRVAQLADEKQQSRADGSIAARSGGPQTTSRVPDGVGVDLEEIIVTGTYIRGSRPTGSPVSVYRREEIEKSGASTVDQFARVMSENFSNVDTIANGQSNLLFATASVSGTNAYQGAAFNLRGIGPTATLTLLNGQRLAAAGLDGSLTDISQIPLSAVERIEVLPDGASAIYGGDAVAGVVNIVTRTDFDGAETSVRYGEASDGGALQLSASQLLGHSWASGGILASYEYDDQDGLDARERDYIPDQGGKSMLIPENTRHSVFVAGNQALGSDTSLFAHALYSDREFATVTNQSGSVFSTNAASSGNAEQSSAALGIDHAFSEAWRLQVSGNHSAVRQKSTGVVTTLIGSVPSPASPTNSVDETNSSVFGVNVLVTGAVASLPAGKLRAALGVSGREEKFESLARATSSFSNLLLAVPEQERTVRSAFGELLIPLIDRTRPTRFARRLELSAAVRHDDYDDFGSSTNPKFGLLWEPTEGVALRGTYGTSFRAPLLNEVAGLGTYTATFAMDPASPFGLTNTLFLQGYNPNLQPEESESFSVGMDFNPERAPGLSVGITYFSIDFTDRIGTPPSSTGGFISLTDPLLAPFVDRNPSQALVQEYFDSPYFLFDATGQGPAGVQAVLDRRYLNIAATKQRGVDLLAAYALPVGPASVSFSLSIQHLLENDLQAIALAPSVSLLNGFGQPSEWKGRTTFTWTQGNYTASLALSHVNEYDNTLFTPPQPIDSWTTGDLYLRYKTDDAGRGVFRGVTIALSVSNLTDEKPPHVQIPANLVIPGRAPIPFDPANASPVGRLISLAFTKRW